MSWDCSIVLKPCEHCRRGEAYEEVRNVTYNNGRIFERLDVHPNSLHGVSTLAVIPIVNRAIELSFLIEEELRALEPSNGWGGLDDARDFLRTLRNKCEANLGGYVHFF